MAREDRPTALAVATLLVGCAAPAPPAPAGGAALAAAARESVRYEVVARTGGELDVVARFPAGTSSRFFVEPGAEPFVVGLAPAGEGAAPGHGEPFERACDRGCELRYRFDLAGAADAFDHVGYAARSGGAFLAPPSTWLLHPRDGDLSRRFELRVTVPEGEAFASGLPRLGPDPAVEEVGGLDPVAGASPVVVGATLADLPSAPYAALGSMRSHAIDAGGSGLQVAVVGSAAPADDEVLLGWVRQASLDVSGILGAPVVPHALVVVEVHEGSGLSLLTALGNGGASIHAPVGRGIDPAVLDRDWRMTHEFVHLGSPGLDRRHAWLSEGLATYLEPIARVRRGRLDERRLWRELVESLPLGQPAAGDAGLDRTPTWGRTYWGGALFCLVADVEARRRTGNTRGLIDAVRAIHRAGGDVRQRWSMLRLIDVGDAAIGAPVLAELYARHRHRAVHVDLERLWGELGVRGPGIGAPRPGEDVALDDAAPLAHVRRAITGGS